MFDAFFGKKTVMPTKVDALPGRPDPIPTAIHHFVNQNPLKRPWPDHLQDAYLAMGCFWGVERLFWQKPGVYVTSVGYAGGFTPNPTYQETVTGQTGHTEVVQVVFDPATISYEQLLTTFWEEHDPTQGMRQGNDLGTTYRSAIYTISDEQMQIALQSRDGFQAALNKAGIDQVITTEIAPLDQYYYAEDYHQQYLAKNPGGYCGLRGTGVRCV